MRLQNKNIRFKKTIQFFVYVCTFLCAAGFVYSADVVSTQNPAQTAPSSVNAADSSKKSASSSVSVAPASARQKVNPQEVAFAKKIKESLAEDSSIEKTLQLFETLPEQSKNSPDMLVLQASLMLSANKMPELNEVLAKLEQIAPENRDAIELSMIVAKVTGNRKKLNEKVNSLLAKDPNNDLANIELAEDALRSNNYSTAVSYYQKALAGNANSEEAMFGLGQCYYYLARPEPSRKYFNKLLEKNEMHANANLYLGKLAAEEGKYRTALKFVEKACEADPENLDAYIDLGSYRHRLLNPKGAEEAWNKAISLAPDFFLTYAYRASLFDEQSRYKEAYEDYKKVVELNPKYFYAYETMGVLAWHEKDYAASYESFCRVLENVPDNFSYNMMVAACLSKGNKKPQMKLHLEKVMKKLNRESVEYNLARLYHDGGGVNSENSVNLLVKREKSGTKRAKYLFYFGLFYELNGFMERASVLYQQCIEASQPLFFEYRLAEWEASGVAALSEEKK